MPASAETLCTNAMLLIGAEEVISFNDDSREARVASALYETTLDKMLEEHFWNFATKQRSLNQVDATPLYGYRYIYQVPTDCLSPSSTENQEDYRILEDKLYTDFDTVNLTYVFRPNAVKMPAYFRRCLELELASLFALAIAEDRAKSDDLKARAKTALEEAKITDSKQAPPRKWAENNFCLTAVRS